MLNWFYLRRKKRYRGWSSTPVSMSGFCFLFCQSLQTYIAVYGDHLLKLPNLFYYSTVPGWWVVPLHVCWTVPRNTIQGKVVLPYLSNVTSMSLSMCKPCIFFIFHCCLFHSLCIKAFYGWKKWFVRIVNGSTMYRFQTPQTIGIKGSLVYMTWLRIQIIQLFLVCPAIQSWDS